MRKKKKKTKKIISTSDINVPYTTDAQDGLDVNLGRRGGGTCPPRRAKVVVERVKHQAQLLRLIEIPL